MRYFVPKQTSDWISKGVELFDAQTDGLVPIDVPAYAVGRILAKSYLLVPLEYNSEERLGLVPDKEHGMIEIWRDNRGTILRKSLDGVVVATSREWKVGDLTTKGIIRQVGDELAVVEHGTKCRAIRKSLLVEARHVDKLKESLEAREFYFVLQKALTATAAGMAAPKSATAGATQKQPSLFAWNRKGGEKPGHKYLQRKPDPKHADKYIYLYELPSGKRQWQDSEGHAVEEGQDLPKKEIEAKEAAKTFNRGDKVKRGGQTGEVQEVGDDFAAIKLQDGKIKVVSKKELAEAEKPDKLEHGQKVRHAGDDWQVHEKGDFFTTLKNEKGDFKIVTNDELLKKDTNRETLDAWRAQRTALEQGIAPTGTSEEHAEAVESALASPKYVEWRSAIESVDGWSLAGNFQAVKNTKDINGNPLEFSHFYNTDTNEVLGLVGEREVKIGYNGEDHAVMDFDPDARQVMLYSKKTGWKNIDVLDLDHFKGELEMDKNGALRVVQGGEKIGELQKSPTLRQSDLFDAGTIKVVNDTVIKRVAVEGAGAKYRDVELGKIKRGIVGYQDSIRIATMDGNLKSSLALKKDIARDIPEVDQTLKERLLAKKMKAYGKERAARSQQRADLYAAKAQVDLGHIDIATERPATSHKLDKDFYVPKFDEYINKAGAGIDERIAEQYGTSEWKATVNTIAQSFRAYDLQKAEEAESFNAMSKGGMKVEVPETRPPEDYVELADDVLKEYRRSYLRDRKVDKEGGRFAWSDMSEAPANAKAITPESSKIRDSKGTVYHVHYAVVPMNDVIASHDTTGHANEEHPSELQARKRTTFDSIKQMQNISKNIDTNLLETSPDATSGAPITYSKGGKLYVAQGNGRAAGIKGSETDQREKYYNLMVEQGKKLGLDTSKFTPDDMLVRVMSPKHSYEDARRLAAYGQKSNALPTTEVEDARAYQNAQRSPFNMGINLGGVGARPISAENVSTFVRDNPVLYNKIVDDSGYNRTDIEAHPEIQAQLVNTAILAQLDHSFIEDVAERDSKTHKFVTRIAPILVDNKRAIAEKELPPSADIEQFVHRVIKMYDGLDSSTKTLLNVKNGASEFLNEDAASANMNGLVHKMRQEDLLSSAGREANQYRDPMNVIGLLAYHQAMNTKEEDGGKKLQTLALKIRRFAEGLSMLNQNQSDMFGAQQTPEERAADTRNRLVAIAERTLLENRTVKPGDEVLSPEDMALSSETLGKLDVAKRMQKMADPYGIKLSGAPDPEQTPLRKAVGALRRLFTGKLVILHQEQVEEVRKSLQVKVAHNTTTVYSFIRKSIMQSAESAMSAPQSAEVREAKPPATGGIAWNKKGGQKPGHKYIERKPNPKNPDKYIYLYEMPNGKKQWQDDEGNVVADVTGVQHATHQAEAKEYALNHFQQHLQPEARVSIGNEHGTVDEVGDTMVAVRFDNGKTELRERNKVGAYSGPPDAPDVVSSAKNYASEITKDKTRKYGNVPYFNHLDKVATLLKDAGLGATTVAAAYVHDSTEDQHVTHAELAKRFGEDVADLVDWVSVTDKSKSWEERNEIYHNQIKAAPPEAKAISCADKISNLSDAMVFDADHWIFKQSKEQAIDSWEKLAQIYKGQVPEKLYEQFTNLISEHKKMDAYNKSIEPFENRKIEDVWAKPDEISDALIDDIKSEETINRYMYNGMWQPQRQDLHDEFVHSKVEGVRENVPDGEREVIILAGGGGSGKTTTAKRVFGDVEKEGTHVWADPDSAKEFIPEYQVLTAKREPTAAGVVHEESSMMNKAVIEEAIKRKQNILVDQVMGDPQKFKSTIERFKKLGYKVTMMLADSPADASVLRAQRRFERTRRLPSEHRLREDNVKAAESFWKTASEYLHDPDVHRMYAMHNHSSEHEPPVQAFHKEGDEVAIDNEEHFNYLVSKGKVDAETFKNPRKHQAPGSDESGRVQKGLGAAGKGRGTGARFFGFKNLHTDEGQKTGQTPGSPAVKSPLLGLLVKIAKAIQGELFSSGTSPLKGRVKPNHKYIRREERGGKYYYVYQDADGNEYSTDTNGQIIDRPLNLPEKATNSRTLWQKIVSQLERDLKQGDASGDYANAENRAELMRKIGEAKEQAEARAHAGEEPKPAEKKEEPAPPEKKEEPKEAPRDFNKESIERAEKDNAAREAALPKVADAVKKLADLRGWSSDFKFRYDPTKSWGLQPDETRDMVDEIAKKFGWKKLAKRSAIETIQDRLVKDGTMKAPQYGTDEATVLGHIEKMIAGESKQESAKVEAKDLNPGDEVMIDGPDGKPRKLNYRGKHLGEAMLYDPKSGMQFTMPYDKLSVEPKETSDEAGKYIDGIENDVQRDYAERYHKWITDGRKEMSPDYNMDDLDDDHAAAVRKKLNALYPAK